MAGLRFEYSTASAARAWTAVIRWLMNDICWFKARNWRALEMYLKHNPTDVRALTASTATSRLFKELLLIEIVRRLPLQAYPSSGQGVHRDFRPQKQGAVGMGLPDMTPGFQPSSHYGAQFLGRCHRMGWGWAVGPQTNRRPGCWLCRPHKPQTNQAVLPRTNQAFNPRTNRAVVPSWTERHRRGLIPALGNAQGLGPQKINPRAAGPSHRTRRESIPCRQAFGAPTHPAVGLRLCARLG